MGNCHLCNFKLHDDISGHTERKLTTVLFHWLCFSLYYWCCRVDLWFLVLKVVFTSRHFVSPHWIHQKYPQWDTKWAAGGNPDGSQIYSCVCVCFCGWTLYRYRVHSMCICTWQPVTTHTCRAVYSQNSHPLLSTCITASYHINKVCLNVNSVVMCWLAMYFHSSVFLLILDLCANTWVETKYLKKNNIL